MKSKYFGIVCIGVACPLATVAESQVIQSKEKPNIILIMSDDMGYSDIGCFGGEIRTPNLDALAKEGLRYTSFYNQGRCCPTRASLMTGLYPHQTGIGWMTAVDHGLPGYQAQLNDKCVTIAEVLKKAGYCTYMSGKWHLQKDSDARRDSSKHNWPLQRGFDRFYGMLVGAGSYYDPTTLCRDNSLITPWTDTEYQPDSYYFTDAITENALSFLREERGDKPFFLYVAYTTAHWPMHAPQEEIDKYRGVYDRGWEFIRRQRFKKMKDLGILGENFILPPSDTRSWETESDRKAMARRMETYAAMIDRMDQGIGRIVNELKNKGLIENTVILYLQDNGGCAESIGFGGPEGQTRPIADDTVRLKPLGKDEIQTVVIPPITREGKVVMAGKAVMAGPPDTYLAYLKPWAMVSNTPFRKYKKYVHEGGISSPLIVHWPAGIGSKGEFRDQTANVIDIMPTILEIAGVEYPASFNGNKITPVAGVSLVPTFFNRKLETRAIFWEHETNRAVRRGRWKLVSTGRLSGGGYGRWKFYQNGEWELYDIEEDRSELRNLSGQFPQIVKELADLWETWANQVHVFPRPWDEISWPLRSYYTSMFEIE